MSAGAISSLDGRIVTILGGSGFLGRHLTQELLARGARVRIASRTPDRAYALKPLGNLGQTDFSRADATRPETLRNAFAGAWAVVNLVGAFAGNLDSLQGEGAGRIAAAARDAGVESFVHVSAIGGDAASPVAYARTKAEGESAVLAAFPEATILRPSLLFGPDDNFVMMFARLIARLPVLPVFAPEAELQPLFVDDAAQAIANALTDGRARGRTYELAGPEVITMAEFNRRIAAAQGRSRTFADLAEPVGAGIAAATGWLPGAPITRDQYALLKAGSVASGTLPGLADLDVRPRPLELFLDRWMVPFRKHGRFGRQTASR